MGHRHPGTPFGLLSGALAAAPVADTVASYAHNLLVSTGLRRLERLDLNVLEDVPAIRGLALQPDHDCKRCRSDDEAEADLSGRHLAEHLRVYLRTSPRPRRVAAPDEPFRANLALVADVLGLGTTERAVLTFLAALRMDGSLRLLVERFGYVTLAQAAEVVAAAVHAPVARVFAALEPRGRLGRSGLLQISSDPGELGDKLQVSAALVEAASVPGLGPEGLFEHFVERAPAPRVSLDDFGPLAPGIRDIAALLAAAVRDGARGINVLLHGPTGVGKTQLAHLLGATLGVPVYVAGKADELGESPIAEERLRSLLVANRIGGSSRGLLLFDELEDLFTWEPAFFGPAQATAQMSKMWFNDLLETNALPTIWISNRIEGIDGAFLRRFTYALELRAGGPRQRARMLRETAGDVLDLSEAERLAAAYEATPGQIATAVRAARMVAAGEPLTPASIERYLAPVERLLRGTRRCTDVLADLRTFRLDAINCTEDLGRLADRLAAWRPGDGPGLSLCFYGPSGTGKSELGKYLAHRMGRRVLVHRVSDIESMWVGQTEKAIAAAFAEAEADDAVLLFDEADSFLRDRTRAAAPWEQNAVNEFLTRLEGFRGVIVCTTNLWRDIDEAALRRFLFKVEFRFLRVEQAEALFRSFFPDALPGAETRVAAGLGRLACLAPGDFAAVARRVRALGAVPGAEELLRMLEAEVRAKRGAPRAIGF